MTFTIIHPSRGRGAKAIATMRKWLKAAVDPDAIQYIFSLDTDEPDMKSYMNLFANNGSPNLSFITNDNDNLVDAVHAAVKLIKNEVVLVVSDDFDPAEAWDAEIEAAVVKYKGQHDKGMTDFAVYVDDCFTYGKRLLTIPIISTALVKKMGYIYYPAFTGMFADNDLYELCEKLGCIIEAPQIKCAHNHFTNGKAQVDATYQRHNTQSSWKIGEHVIAKRRECNFNIEYIGKPLFSICIPTLDERKAEFDELMAVFDMAIYNNCFDHVVEIVSISDNRVLTVGAKRQKLLEMAKGKFVASFDDDDMPYAIYLPSIIGAIKENPSIDCIGIWGMMTTNGKNPKKWCHRLGYPIAEKQMGYDYVRPIWHFNPVLRSKALQVGFKDIKFGEDQDYALRLAPLLSNEFFIRDAMFHYRYTPKKY